MILSRDQILTFLLGQQTISGGFPNEIGQSADLLTTSSVIKLLVELGEATRHKDQVKRALLFLYQAQEPSGKWGNGYKVWETAITSKVLRAFHRCGLEITSDPLQRGFMWLLGKQKSNGAFVQNDTVFTPHVYATVCALRLFCLLDNSYQEVKDKALQWLSEIQNQDGGFSLQAAQASDPCLSAYVLESLLFYDNYLHSNMGQNLIQYLLDAQSGDGTWRAWFEPDRPSIEATATCISVLSRVGSKGPFFRKAYSYIEERMDLGKWDAIPLWQMVSVLYALSPNQEMKT